MFVTKALAEEAKPAAEAQHGEAPAAEGAHGAAGETHNTETGVPHDAGHSGVFPPFDATSFASQLLWLAITFGLFYLFISRVASPRIGSILETRRDRIARDLAEAAKAKEEADGAVAAYETELATARKNALDIGNKARDAAKAKADADRKTAEAGLDGMLATADKRISDLRASGMKEVGKIAEDTASAILTQLTGGKYSASEIANAIKSVKG
jgi:F-type H+-transporting ATPase subunit b